MKKKLAIVLANTNLDTKKRIQRNINTLLEGGYEMISIAPQASQGNNIDNIALVSTDVGDVLAGNGFGKVKLLFILVIKTLVAFILNAISICNGLFYYKLIYKIYPTKREQSLFKSVDLILVEDVTLSHIAFNIKSLSGAKTILDLRDFYWDNEILTKPARWNLHGILGLIIKPINHFFLRKMYRYSMKKFDKIICVSYGHAEMISRIFGVEAIVVFSAPEYKKYLKPRASNENKINLVYHGIGARERCIDVLIEAVNRANKKIILHLFLTDISNDELSYLKKISSDRVMFHNPIPYDNLIEKVNEYDAGLAFFPPLHSSLAAALPNKFFEYLQSRIAIISGPTPDMARLINEMCIGVVSTDFSLNSLINAINYFAEASVDEMKSNSDKAAAVLCFENEVLKLKTVFDLS